MAVFALLYTMVGLLALLSLFILPWAIWRWRKRPSTRTGKLRAMMMASAAALALFALPTGYLIYFVTAYFGSNETIVLREGQAVGGQWFEEGDRLHFIEGELWRAELTTPRRIGGYVLQNLVYFRPGPDDAQQVSGGELAQDTVIDDIPCRAGHVFHLTSEGRLFSCMTAQPMEIAGIVWPMGSDFRTDVMNPINYHTAMTGPAPFVVPKNFHPDLRSDIRLEQNYSASLIRQANGQWILTLIALNGTRLPYVDGTLKRLDIRPDGIIGATEKDFEIRLSPQKAAP